MLFLPLLSAALFVLAATPTAALAPDVGRIPTSADDVQAGALPTAAAVESAAASGQGQPSLRAPPAYLRNESMGVLKSSSAAPIPMARSASMTFKLFAGNTTAGSADMGDILELTMTTSVPGKYIAFGTSARHMTGLLLFCFVSAEVTAGPGDCEVWAGDKHDVSRMRKPPVVHLQASRVHDNCAGFEVTVRVAASEFGVIAGRQRVVTAVGPYDAATKTPLKHGHDDYSHLELDFSTGELKLPRTKYFMWIAIVVDVFVAVVYCAVATMLHRCTRVMVRPLAWSCMNGATMATLVLMCAVVGVGRALDATADLQPTPWARGFAAAGVTGGVITLFPTPKLLNPGWLFGATYERLIPFHRVAAIVLFVGGTVHTGMAMSALPTLADMLLTSGYNNNLLAGLVAWVCFFIVTVSSVLGLPRRKMFWLWRLVHCLYVPGYIACVVHYPPMLLGLAVPLVLFVCDLVARGLAVVLTGAKIKSVRVFDDADVVEVDVELTGRLAPSSVSPGDFVHMGFMTTANWALHPFTIAWYDSDAKVATFYIKAMSTSWSGKLLEYAKATPEKLIGTRVLWVGPSGTLQVPIGRVPNTVLVSGGIGVTPMLATLQYLSSAAAKDGSSKKKMLQGPKVGGGDKVDRCLFVWAARGEAMINAFRPRIEEAAEIAGAEVLIFDTSKKANTTDLDEKSTHFTGVHMPSDNNQNSSRQRGIRHSEPTTRKNTTVGDDKIALDVVPNPISATGRLSAGAGALDLAVIMDTLAAAESPEDPSVSGVAVAPTQPSSTPASKLSLPNETTKHHDPVDGVSTDLDLVEAARMTPAAAAANDIPNGVCDDDDDAAVDLSDGDGASNDFAAAAAADSGAVPVEIDVDADVDVSTECAAIESGRPDIPEILRAHFLDGVPVALYACGPHAMLERCYDAASGRPETFLHRETFDM